MFSKQITIATKKIINCHWQGHPYTLIKITTSDGREYSFVAEAQPKFEITIRETLTLNFNYQILAYKGILINQALIPHGGDPTPYENLKQRLQGLKTGDPNFSLTKEEKGLMNESVGIDWEYDFKEPVETLICAQTEFKQLEQVSALADLKLNEKFDPATIKILETLFDGHYQLLDQSQVMYVYENQSRQRRCLRDLITDAKTKLEQQLKKVQANIDRQGFGNNNIPKGLKHNRGKYEGMIDWLQRCETEWQKNGKLNEKSLDGLDRFFKRFWTRIEQQPLSNLTHRIVDDKSDQFLVLTQEVIANAIAGTPNLITTVTHVGEQALLELDNLLTETNQAINRRIVAIQATPHLKDIQQIATRTLAVAISNGEFHFVDQAIDLGLPWQPEFSVSKSTQVTGTQAKDLAIGQVVAELSSNIDANTWQTEIIRRLTKENPTNVETKLRLLDRTPANIATKPIILLSKTLNPDDSITITTSEGNRGDYRQITVLPPDTIDINGQVLTYFDLYIWGAAVLIDQATNPIIDVEVTPYRARVTLNDGRTKIVHAPQLIPRLHTHPYAGAFDYQDVRDNLQVNSVVGYIMVFHQLDFLTTPLILRNNTGRTGSYLTIQSCLSNGSLLLPLKRPQGNHWSKFWHLIKNLQGVKEETWPFVIEVARDKYLDKLLWRSQVQHRHFLNIDKTKTTRQALVDNRIKCIGKKLVDEVVSLGERCIFTSRDFCLVDGAQRDVGLYILPTMLQARLWATNSVYYKRARTWGKYFNHVGNWESRSRDFLLQLHACYQHLGQISLPLDYHLTLKALLDEIETDNVTKHDVNCTHRFLALALTLADVHQPNTKTLYDAWYNQLRVLLIMRAKQIIHSQVSLVQFQGQSYNLPGMFTQAVQQHTPTNLVGAPLDVEQWDSDDRILQMVADKLISQHQLTTSPYLPFTPTAGDIISALDQILVKTTTI